MKRSLVFVALLILVSFSVTGNLWSQSQHGRDWVGISDIASDGKYPRLAYNSSDRQYAAINGYGPSLDLYIFNSIFQPISVKKVRLYEQPDPNTPPTRLNMAIGEINWDPTLKKYVIVGIVSDAQYGLLFLKPMVHLINFLRSMLIVPLGTMSLSKLITTNI